jgi:hypothetical protein
MSGKRVQFDDETLHALTVLARDRTMDFHDLADEAFSDLLRKHGRPADHQNCAARKREEKGFGPALTVRPLRPGAPFMAPVISVQRDCQCPAAGAGYSDGGSER